MLDINWKKIFDQIRKIIEVLTKRFYEVKEWLAPYIKEEEESST